MCGSHSWLGLYFCQIALPKMKGDMLLTFHLSGIPGSGSWLLHQRVAHAMLLLLPVCEQMKVWGICVRCPGTPLCLLEENVYLKSPWFHLSLACISPQARPCQETAHILITFLAWTRRQMDVSLRHGAPRAQSPGSLSQLTFRFTCNHDNAIDASCHGA